MTFHSLLQEHIQKIKSYLPHIHSEESTKHSLVLPFFRALGYDTTNPSILIPELPASIWSKKAEKADYGLAINGGLQIIVECKHWESKLDDHVTQLSHYYTFSEARFALLTNGIEFRFYADFVKANFMDEEAFFTINLLECNSAQIETLGLFHYDQLQADTIIQHFSEVRQAQSIAHWLQQELSEPSPAFLHHLSESCFGQPLEANALLAFRKIAQQGIAQFLAQRGFMPEIPKPVLPSPTPDAVRPEPTTTTAKDTKTPPADAEAVNFFDIPTDGFTGKKLEYFVFRGERIDKEAMVQLYIHVCHTLYQDNPSQFLATLQQITTRKLIFDRDMNKTLSTVELSPKHHLCIVLSNNEKQRYLHKLLTHYKLTDQLFVKLHTA